jgi:hypothetical protein
MNYLRTMIVPTAQIMGEHPTHAPYFDGSKQAIPAGCIIEFVAMVTIDDKADCHETAFPGGATWTGSIFEKFYQNWADLGDF